MEVGFTGTRRGMTQPQKDAFRRVLAGLEPDWLHHGDCVGADAEASAIADELGVRVHLHPPTDERRRAFCRADAERPRRPHLDRNHDIVDVTSRLIATPGGFKEKLRSGTWATIRYARRGGGRVCIIWPDGRVEG